MKIPIVISILSTFCFFSVLNGSEQSSNSCQNRLNKGESPRKIMRSGVPMDSLYGKFYQGGYIFYFFSKDSSGMVMGPKNLHYDYDTSNYRIYWSCRGKFTGATGKKIGDGPVNTRKIVNSSCTLYDPDEKRWMKSAAELCVAYKGGGYNDWFLPSQGELHQACLKLSQSGLYNFDDKTYWSSTEVDTLFAYVEHFRLGPQEHPLFGQSGYRKFYDDYVRPVRVFK